MSDLFNVCIYDLTSSKQKTNASFLIKYYQIENKLAFYFYENL